MKYMRVVREWEKVDGWKKSNVKPDALQSLRLHFSALKIARCAVRRLETTSMEERQDLRMQKHKFVIVKFGS